MSVVICTASVQRWPLLLETIKSVRSQTVAAHELVVVVDHNDDLERRLVMLRDGVEAPPLVATSNLFARGLAGARNTGVKLSRGEVVAFIDDDAAAARDWLERLAAVYSDPQVWGVGGRIVPRWEVPRPKWFPDEFAWVIGCSYHGMPAAPTEVRNLLGCNASFRRELFEKVGLFSLALGRRGSSSTGGEETELCLRATALHPERKCMLNPHAVVSHTVAKERARVRYFASRCFGEGRSKAWLVRSTGRRRGLSDEALYLRSIPRGVARYLKTGLRHGELGRLQQAGTCLIGAGAAVAGFLTESIPVRTSAQPPSALVPPYRFGTASAELANPGGISVVICTYASDRWQFLVEAVRSVKDQTLAAREIVVAVDHNDELARRVRDEIEGVTVTENEGPRGLSGARNAAVAKSREEIVAFLDDDAVADAEWLDRLRRPFDEPRVLAVGGFTESRWSTGRPFWWPEEFDWVVGGSYRGMPRKRRVVRNVHGGNAAYRRSIFDLVGGFRSDIGRARALPYGGEETELCIRASQMLSEARFVFEPAARIAHHVPAERGQLRYFFARCLGEGISKARIASGAGMRDALATESPYVRHVLWKAVFRSSLRAVPRGDLQSLSRAAAISAGVSVTMLGFLVGVMQRDSARWRLPSPRRAPRAAFIPSEQSGA